MSDALPNLINLPDPPVALLENPPLKLALCQIRFPVNLGIANAGLVAPFQQAIQSDYPIAAPVDGVQMQVSLGSGSVGQPRPFSNWQFADATDTWRVVLAQDFVALETRAYNQFADYLDHLRRVLQALKQHIRPNTVTRVGLRYINEIRSPSAEWKGWDGIVRPDLLGLLAAGDLIGNAVHRETVCQSSFRFSDNQGINLRYGLLPGGTTVQPRPGEETSPLPFFLLDFDAYREYPLPSGALMDPTAICEHIAMFNNVIYRLFRWAVSEKFLGTLGVRDGIGG